MAWMAAWALLGLSKLTNPGGKKYDNVTESEVNSGQKWVKFRPSTHMPVYHCHKPVFLGKWPLLQVCYKPKNNVAKHAHLGY